MTRGIIVQNWVWHLQIFFASNYRRSIFVFLLRSSMSLIDLSTAGGLKWSSPFQKTQSWILWSMNSNVQFFDWNYWSCHSGPARLGEIGNGYGDLYCGSRSLMDIEFDWSIAIARGTLHIPRRSGRGFFWRMVQIMRKNSKTWFLSSDRHSNTSCVPHPRTLSSSSLEFYLECIL